MFKRLDIVADADSVKKLELDAFMVRDVIQHLPLEEAVRAFNNLRESHIKYIIISNWRNITQNNIQGTEYGGNNRNNIYSMPFKDAPPPIEVCDNYDGVNNMVRWPIDLLLLKNE